MIAVRAFDLAGTRLHIRGPAELDLSGLDLLIGRLESAHIGKADYEIEIRSVAVLPRAPDWPVVWQGELPEGPSAVRRESEAGLDLRIEGRLALTSCTSGRSSVLSVTPASAHLVGGTAGVLAVEDALASAGQVLVHGACLHLPDRHEAIFISAPSGTGKSTTALALARSGWALCGDDASVLTGCGVSIWSLPRAVKVDRTSVGLLPWLAAVIRNFGAADEASIPIERLEPVVPIARATPAPLAAIIVLAPRTGGSHQLYETDKPSALVALASDNVFRRQSDIGWTDRLRFQLLSAAVRRARTFELRVGRDLSSLGEVLRSGLASSNNDLPTTAASPAHKSGHR